VAHVIGAGASYRLVDAFERRGLYGVAAIDQQAVAVAGGRFADEDGFGESARRRLAGHKIQGSRFACMSVAASKVTVTNWAVSNPAVRSRIGIRRRME
jgi:hypothetical protein